MTAARLKTFRHVRLACAYFFACPGLAYGLFTSRLPAFKAMTGANDSDIGLVLLCFGLASLAGLFICNIFITRSGSRIVLRTGSLILLTGIILCGMTSSPFQLAVTLAISGFGMGLCDVSMNTLGIEIEHQYKISCMSFLHASYSLGGMLGSIAGAIFAGLPLSPLINALAVLGAYACLLPWAIPRLPRRHYHKANSGEKRRFGRIPLYILTCGFLAMLAYASEGSVGEWGSIYLHGDKGASTELAALVFAAFSITTVTGRLCGDGLRAAWGDFALMLSGALLAFLGMAIVIFLDNPILCLCGYAIMGLGLAPIVPIIFSRAGDCPGISASAASAVVSIFAYSGLLFFPPLLGFVGEHQGLSSSLLLILTACLVIGAGSVAICRKNL